MKFASPGILGGLEDPGKEVYIAALPSSPIVQETETSLSENRESCMYIYLYMYIQTTPPHGHSLPLSVSPYPLSDSLSFSGGLETAGSAKGCTFGPRPVETSDIEQMETGKYQQDHLDMVQYQINHTQ